MEKLLFDAPCDPFLECAAPDDEDISDVLGRRLPHTRARVGKAPQHEDFQQAFRYEFAPFHVNEFCRIGNERVIGDSLCDDEAFWMGKKVPEMLHVIRVEPNTDRTKSTVTVTLLV